jgi:alkylation response protein AidB-like acyl-CoA dehydrogenase
MDLTLSDHQEQLVASFGALLEKQSAAEQVRAAEPTGFDAELWAALRSVGVVEMAVPEGAGGWGAELIDLTLVAELLGQSCAPAPVIENQVAARLLARLGTPAQPHLAGALGGEQLVTIALHAPIAQVATLVPAGAVADVVLIADLTGVQAVATNRLNPHAPNHGCLPLADISTGSAVAIASGDGALEDFDRAIDEWLLLTASSLVGLSAGALAIAVEYAKERTAFGAPIGSFQGIAHPLADAATAIDGARLLVREAAWSADRGHPESGERAAMAFAFAAETARRATYTAVHTLGGYGVMIEYDTQLYYRRARGWAGVFGDATAAYRRVARYRYIDGGVGRGL